MVAHVYKSNSWPHFCKLLDFTILLHACVSLSMSAVTNNVSTGVEQGWTLRQLFWLSSAWGTLSTSRLALSSSRFCSQPLKPTTCSTTSCCSVKVCAALSHSVIRLCNHTARDGHFNQHYFQTVRILCLLHVIVWGGGLRQDLEGGELYVLHGEHYLWLKPQVKSLLLGQDCCSLKFSVPLAVCFKYVARFLWLLPVALTNFAEILIIPIWCSQGL